jgi:spore germination protein YaaH
MLKILIIVITGILLGISVTYYLLFYTFAGLPKKQQITETKKQVIGFLPYWELNTATIDYTSNITMLSYFGVVVDKDGTLVKLSSPQQEQPGWNGLQSGKVAPFFQNAKQHNIALSLVIDSGNSDAIAALINDPVNHAKTLAAEIIPLINQYGFTDLNFDIEYTAQASPIARANFTKFIQEVKKQVGNNITITLDISTLDAIKPNLIDLQTMGTLVNNIVIMAYDYHAQGSYVTGPVAPLSGAGITSEYDVTTAVAKTMQSVPAQKIIVGMPAYGYAWETLTKDPRSAIIPGTGVIASNQRSEAFRESCATCSAKFDTEAQEGFISYKDPTIHTYHQFFYPNQQSVLAKLQLANTAQLGGVALWALGYEGSTMLQPLTEYKHE